MGQKPYFWGSSLIFEVQASFSRLKSHFWCSDLIFMVQASFSRFVMKPLIDESNFDWVRCTRVSWQGQSNVSSFVNVLIRKSTLLHMKRDMGKMVVIHFFISQHPVYYFRRHLKIDILRFKILDFSIISHCYICQDI